MCPVRKINLQDEGSIQLKPPPPFTLHPMVCKSVLILSSFCLYKCQITIMTSDLAVFFKPLKKWGKTLSLICPNITGSRCRKSKQNDHYFSTYGKRGLSEGDNENNQNFASIEGDPAPPRPAHVTFGIIYRSQWDLTNQSKAWPML